MEAINLITMSMYGTMKYAHNWINLNYTFALLNHSTIITVQYFYGFFSSYFSNSVVK